MLEKLQPKTWLRWIYLAEGAHGPLVYGTTEPLKTGATRTGDTAPAFGEQTFQRCILSTRFAKGPGEHLVNIC